MVQEAYPGSDAVGGKAMKEYLYGKKVKLQPKEDDALEKACQLICKQTEELVKLRIQVEDLSKLKSSLIITDQQKKAIYAAYVEWSNQVFDDLEDKSNITAEELVYRVLEIVEEKLA